jgi:hypothetical protein
VLIIPELGRQRQDCQFKTSLELDYISRSCLSLPHPLKKFIIYLTIVLLLITILSAIY